MKFPWNTKKQESENEKRVFWRDTNGKIRCLGDSCVLSECDTSCPIWINTLGLQLISMGKYQDAIKSYEKALELAPDFSDAWHNKAMAHGMNDQHDKAFECCKKAYELEGKNNALYGMALAKAQSGDYQEALDLCNEYEKKFSDGKVSKIKKDMEEILGDNPQKNYMDFFAELLMFGKREGIIKSAEGSAPFIPELIPYMTDICQSLFTKVKDLNEKEGEPIDSTIRLTALWCGFAGIGAVALWNNDWNQLKEKGLEPMLLEPRGLDCMDEYVCSLIGINSTEQKEFKDIGEHLMGLCLIELQTIDADGDQFVLEHNELFKAMYMYGMAFEMNQLGMH